MTMIYSNPAREQEDGALPDVEVLKGYEFTCSTCRAVAPLSAGYYGIVNFDTVPCDGCGAIGTLDNFDAMQPRWYWQPCFPGCLPDGDPVGPFDTEAEAVADAQAGSDYNRQSASGTDGAK